MKKDSRRTRPSRRTKSDKKNFSHLSRIKDTSSTGVEEDIMRKDTLAVGTTGDPTQTEKGSEPLQYQSVTSDTLPSQQDKASLWEIVLKWKEIIGVIVVIGGIIISIVIAGNNLVNKVDNIENDVDNINTRTEALANDSVKQSKSLDTIEKYIFEIRNDIKDIQFKEDIIKEIRHNKNTN